MKKKEKTIRFWNLQCRLSFRLERIAYWLVIIAHAIYNYRLKGSQRFPTDAVSDKARQGIDGILKDLT